LFSSTYTIWPEIFVYILVYIISLVFTVPADIFPQFRTNHSHHFALRCTLGRRHGLRALGSQQLRVGHLAFKISEAFSHLWRRYAFSGYLRQTESLELVHIPPRAVADLDNLDLGDTTTIEETLADAG